jgi:Zn-dependent M28 family amino/carboxypeptidase
MNYKYLIFAIVLSFLSACGFASHSNKAKQDNTTARVVPIFNPDSAYHYVKAQCDFGPRVPGTEAHAACLNYFVEQFNRFNADTIIVQEGETMLYDGSKMPIRNVVASYGIGKPNRVMICAHWDSRAFADNDINPDNRRKPIIGANDGASGVGVILELARQLGTKDAAMGVDLILFDLEDWGAPDWAQSQLSDGGWALGSKYWAQRPHIPGYQAQFAILLDMVGAPGAQFYREYFSDQYASWVIDRVWNKAADLGLSHIFVNQRGGGVTDDHLNVIRAGIPCIDIIQFQPDTESGFGDYWHTHNDDMRNIDPSTLDAVGRVLMEIVY